MEADSPTHGGGGESSSSGAVLVDTRLIQKPTRYSGDEAAWRDWRFAFENYLCCLEPSYLEELNAAAAATESF